VRKTTGSAQIVVQEIDVDHELTVFRIVRSEHREDPVFLNSLRSNYEMGDEPRKVERSSSVIHMGISTYSAESVAIGTAQKWDKLGDYIAQLRLPHGLGINFARTGHPLHLTIWGDPVKLRDVVVGIQPVDR
jgi:hypothetical protein